MKQRENLNQFKGAYSSQFKFYEENQWYLSHYAARLCQVLHDRNLKSLLSLGIGHQVVCDRVLKEFEHSLEMYTILEGSKEIINDFKARHDLIPGVNLVQTYFEEYDSDLTYDAIELGFVLEHVDDPAIIVERFKHYLAPGGTMFISVPNARSLHRLIGYEAGLLNDIYHLSSEDHLLGHKRYFDLESISRLVEASGLKIVQRQGLMLKPVTGNQIQQLGWGENIIAALMKLGDGYPEIANCILLEAVT